MPSTYSDQLRIELQANGENDGSWGTKTNTNLELLESAISGLTSFTVTSADVTLTANNGADDQARHMILSISGTLTGNRSVIVPTKTKLYLVKNACTGAYTLTVKTSAGTGVVVAQGESVFVYCDGTNVVRGPVLSGWVLLDTKTASNSAALDFTKNITSDFSTYMLEITDLIPASQANIWLRFSIGGSVITANYQANQSGIDMGTGAFSNYTGGTSVGQIAIANEPGTATAESMTGIIYISNPTSSTNYKKAWGQTVANRQANGPTLTSRSSVFYGTYTGAATALDGFRILAESGNLESGTVRLWGLRA